MDPCGVPVYSLTRLDQIVYHCFTYCSRLMDRLQTNQYKNDSGTYISLSLISSLFENANIYVNRLSHLIRILESKRTKLFKVGCSPFCACVKRLLLGGASCYNHKFPVRRRNESTHDHLNVFILSHCKV